MRGGRGSVSGLVLVVPSVEVVVEEDDASRGHSSDDAPLVVGHGHAADPGVAGRIREQLFEVMELPHRHHASISSHQQVLTVSAQLHGLDTVVHLHVALQFSIDAEDAEVASVVVNHAVSL